MCNSSHKQQIISHKQQISSHKQPNKTAKCTEFFKYFHNNKILKIRCRCQMSLNGKDTPKIQTTMSLLSMRLIQRISQTKACLRLSSNVYVHICPNKLISQLFIR